MNILKVIRDKDIGSDTPDASHYEIRKAARAIVFDSDGNVGLLLVGSKNYHKISGGGIEEGEDIQAALKREILEELGCHIKNVRELGIIEEYRNKMAMHQISYCFIADIAGQKGVPQFDHGEQAENFKHEWLTLKSATQTLESDQNVADYEGKFIVLRDLTFLRETVKAR